MSHAPAPQGAIPPRNPGPWRAAAAALLLLAASNSFAIGKLVLEIESVALPQAQAADVAITLDLTQPAPTARVQASRLTVQEPVGTLRNVDFTCARLVVHEPQFACRDGRLAARGGPLGSLALQAAVQYDSDAAQLTFEGTELALAGGRARLQGMFGEQGWSMQTEAEALTLAGLRKLMAPWLQLPEQISLEGRVDTRVSMESAANGTRMQLEARAADVNLGNPEGTIVAEKVAALIQASAQTTDEAFDFDAQVTGTAGQALFGPVFLDFGANPLQLHARGDLRDDTLRLSDFAYAQKQLIDARGEATVRLGDSPMLQQARIDVASLEFPAAYRSFMQLPLATTDFGALETAGRASGRIELAASSIERLDVRLDAIDIGDARNRFTMQQLRGEVHWSAAADAAAAPSRLAWNGASAYGLSGAAAQIDFSVRGRDFELLEATRLPVFDGALVVHSLAARRLGQEDAEVDFDAHIEPISMPLVSRAFGWPELSGRLAGRIPGLTYRNRELAVDGDIVADVFDGTIVGRNFRLRDPFGPWPRLRADVTARRLDLDLVTRTFPIGSITGRLDADIQGLELFNWSPVAFDARLYTTPGDRSRHLISQKAVTSISSVGGGGGGVAAALQSGVLRFFDVFRYDRIGIACRLRNDICLMSGIEPAGSGYYIVKGRGLPRIDVIGNAGRVDWPQLVAQIVAGMRSEGVVVQ